MAKRIYHLSIEFDSETEEVEYILETLDEVEDSKTKLKTVTKINSINLSDHFDEETLKQIAECTEMGET